MVAKFSLSLVWKIDLILNRQLMTVFRRVKRVRFKLVEGSSCKSLVLTGFFSASPSPNKMWIRDGDRASGIFLSFGEEITAAQEPGVGELVEAGHLAAAAPLLLLVVQKEIVSCLLDFVLFDVKFLMCSFDNLTGTYPM